MLELAPDVQIVALVGGYLLVTEEPDPESDNLRIVRRSCGSIDEVIRHVINTLVLIDCRPAKDYDQIEKRING